MNHPEVSVVVPSYNAGHFLDWTLASIAAQTFKNFECIVIDDYSTDDSIAKAKKHFADPRFRLIRHKMNVGLSGARNTGLRAARGEFVAFLDADDLMMSNSLEVRLATCRWGQRTGDRFAGSYCGSISIEETLQVAPESTAQSLDYVTFVASSGHCPFNANQPMIRRDILRAAGGFNHGLKQAEDFDLWLRILRAGYIFAPARHAAVTYRKRAGSMVRQQPLAHLELSLAIVNSADKPLADDQLDWSPRYRMVKPLSAYTSQQRKINRTLEFVGMNLASDQPETTQTLTNLVRREIPDLHLLTHSETHLEAILHRGILRQRSTSGPIEDRDHKMATRLLGEIATRTESDTSTGRLSNVLAVSSVYGDPSKDRPWFSGMQGHKIVFIPHSAYHVWTISLIGKALKDIGVDFITVDISAEWRDGKVRSAAAEHGIELIALSEFILGRYRPRAIVTFNDWDPVTRPILIAAKASGILTIAIVEGIQDYDDADVHWKRFAYKTSDVVLLPGDFDKKYFEGHKATVASVGVPRIETLRTKPKREWTQGVKPSVLINCNFSYGVLVEHRDRWLTEAVETVLELGMTPVISRHPGDAGVLYPEYVTSENFYDALERCDVSIQRFASGVLESLARDVGVIYFNPHGENVDKFQADPMGAYTLALDKSALKEQLSDWWKLHEMAIDRGPAFLDHHSGPLGEGAIVRCARALKDNLGTEPTAEALSTFRKNLQILDEQTASFTQVRFNNEPLFPDPFTAEEKLLSMGGKSCHVIERFMKAVTHHADEATADFLLRIATENRKDALFLRSLASHLLTDGKNALSLVEAEQSIKAAMTRAFNNLAPDNALLSHFNSVMELAKRKYV